MNLKINLKQKYFQKNIKLLEKIHPFLVHQLTLTDPSDLKFCRTEREEINLKRSYQGQEYYYHSPVSALEEAQNWFKSLDLHLATVLFIYGIGLGYYYQAAQIWLKKDPHHTLIFLEEDVGVIYRLCETQTGCNLLKDSQVQLIYLHNDDYKKALFNELSWTYFQSSFTFSSLKLYQEVNPERTLKLQHELFHDLMHKKESLSEYLQYGITFFRNFYSNLMELPKSYWGNGLFQCFPQVPAIICGAGPSLNKNIHLLSHLKDRALIFAGGSALNALIPKGIIPHFGVAIDPNKDQYARLLVTQPHSIPIFYRNRLFHEALLAIKGPRLYLTGAGGYPIANWFEQHLNIEGDDLDEGHNVINFALEIAQALGCNPIILIGMDLAFTDQKSYAEGILSDLNLTEIDLQRENMDSAPLLSKDIHGQPIYTLWKWITEAKWISKFAQIYPETKVINATEGGLGFKGVINLTLSETQEQFLQIPKDEIKHLDLEIHKYPLAHISTKQIQELLFKLKTSLDHCIHLITQSIQERELLIQQIKKSVVSSFHRQIETFSLLDSHLTAEIAYSFLLDIFDQIYTHIHRREIQNLHSPKNHLPKKKRLLKELNIQHQRLVFLRDVARINREFILKVSSYRDSSAKKINLI